MFTVPEQKYHLKENIRRSSVFSPVFAAAFDSLGILQRLKVNELLMPLTLGISALCDITKTNLVLVNAL